MRGSFSDLYAKLACVAGLFVCWGCESAKPPQPAEVTSERSQSDTPVPAPMRLPRADDWFDDVSSALGVRARYETGRAAGRNTLLETVGGGVGLVDFDRDGRLDIYSVGGGTIDPSSEQPQGVPGQLLRQRHDEHFQGMTTAARLTDPTGYSHGIVAGDFDNDGFSDLFLTCFGRCILWRNQGDGTFDNVTESAGLTVPGWSTAAAFADVNGDGNADLFVAGYVDWSPGSGRAGTSPPDDVPPPQHYSPVPDHLYLNLGDGRFEDVTSRAGIRSDGMGLGVLAADLNRDGWVDLYVANDVVANHLYWGGPDFPLREAAESSGLAYNDSGTPEGSMGVDAADVNGDNRLDLWLTNFELEDNSLSLNLGDGLFQHATSRMGLAGQGRVLVGFGTGFQDFDADGWPDLYVLNGHVQYHSKFSPFRQPASLLRNRDGQRFEDVTGQGGPWFSVPHTARGGAAGDWNNDGAIDLVVSSLDEPFTLLRNRNPIKKFVRLQLVGTISPRDPVGATIVIDEPLPVRTHSVMCGRGYLSHSDTRLIVPIPPDAEAMKLVVLWPSRHRERFEVPTDSGEAVIVEGRGENLD